MKAIIIDDEKRARLLLKALLADHCPAIQVIGDYADLPTGVNAIQRGKPDLVFLDIELPEQSGLQILDYFEVSPIDFAIIFVTAYNEYAIQAFKLSAIDYVLKPINPEKLVEAVAHFEAIRRKQSALLETLKANLFQAEKRIVIPSRDDLKFINPDDILFVKADGSYSQFQLRSGKRVLMSRNLKHVEDLLKDFLFLQRLHKSYIVNCNEIDIFQKGASKVRLKNGVELPATVEKMEQLGLI